MPQRKHRMSAGFFVSLILLWRASAIAQEGYTAPQAVVDPKTLNTPNITTRALLVEVPTFIVEAPSAKALVLGAQDFLLTDNGVSRPVRLEQDRVRPLSLVVVMQTGGYAKLMFPQYKKLEAALEPLLASSDDRVALVSFDSRVEGATPFTSHLAEWRDALNEPD